MAWAFGDVRDYSILGSWDDASWLYGRTALETRVLLFRDEIKWQHNSHLNTFSKNIWRRTQGGADVNWRLYCGWQSHGGGTVFTLLPFYFSERFLSFFFSFTSIYLFAIRRCEE